MKIQVRLSRTNDTREINLENGSTVEDLLTKIKLKPDTVIVMSGDHPIPVDDLLKPGHLLTIIQVSSGG